MRLSCGMAVRGVSALIVEESPELLGAGPLLAPDTDTPAHRRKSRSSAAASESVMPCRRAPLIRSGDRPLYRVSGWTVAVTFGGGAVRPNGQAVIVAVSDPWELTADIPSNSPRGSVVASQGFTEGVEQEVMPVRMDRPLEWEGRSHPWLILTPRRGQGLFEALSDTSDLECNFYAVPDGSLPDPNDLKDYVASWRGGLSGIASVRLDV